MILAAVLVLFGIVAWRGEVFVHEDVYASFRAMMPSMAWGGIGMFSGSAVLAALVLNQPLLRLVASTLALSAFATFAERCFRDYGFWFTGTTTYGVLAVAAFGCVAAHIPGRHETR